eukprot:m.143104 g.143104  ORF g.143104 m.143104 type:complete len:689 (-) comp10047_c0_seq1:110-2176(-)
MARRVSAPLLLAVAALIAGSFLVFHSLQASTLPAAHENRGRRAVAGSDALPDAKVQDDKTFDARVRDELLQAVAELRQLVSQASAPGALVAAHTGGDDDDDGGNGAAAVAAHVHSKYPAAPFQSRRRRQRAPPATILVDKFAKKRSPDQAHDGAAQVEEKEVKEEEAGEDDDDLPPDNDNANNGAAGDNDDDDISADAAAAAAAAARPNNSKARNTARKNAPGGGSNKAGPGHGQPPAKSRRRKAAAEDTRGQIVSVLFRWCLDDVSDSQVELWQCQSNAYEDKNQYWTWTQEGMLVNALDVKCLDATNAKEGDAISIQACDKEAPGQQWDAVRPKDVRRGSAAAFLRNRGSGLCLAPQTTGPDMHVATLEQCDQSCHQVWFVYALPAGVAHEDYHILGRNVSMSSAPLTAPPPPPRPPSPPGQRLLCWVMSNPAVMETRGFAVNATWGPECDILLFATTEHHKDFNTFKVRLGEEESRNMLWRKAQAAWMYVYHNYLDKADWFMRVDDDSFVMVDNLRDFLKGYDHTEAHYLGRALHARRGVFYSGGAGNILSHEALRILGEAAIKDIDTFADHDTFADDLELARTLLKLGIPTEDTTDDEGRQRFFALGINSERTLSPDLEPTHWWWRYAPDHKTGLACCSKRWIVNHYTRPADMFLLKDMHDIGCEAAGKDPPVVYYRGRRVVAE